MKAIILSAGVGRRLRPTTEELPKCLLPVDDTSPVLELQLRALARCGVRQAVVMVGFGADKVEHFLATRPHAEMRVHTRYNPFFATTNTMVTCWLAIPEMTEEFILLNGDTLFETEILRRVLAAPHAPLTLAIDRKAHYDDDDMKISLNGGRRLKAVGKALPTASIDGESLGLMVFRREGSAAFQVALNAAVRDPAALRQWYHDIISCMAVSIEIATEDIHGLWWKEIDTFGDLVEVREHLAARKHLVAGASARP